MCHLVHGLARDNEVLLQAGDRLFSGLDEVDGLQLRDGLPPLVDVLHDCKGLVSFLSYSKINLFVSSL